MTARDYIMQPRADPARGAQDTQPVAQLRLPDAGLLLLAAGRGAWPQGRADGDHRARADAARILRLRAGRARGHAQPHASAAWPIRLPPPSGYWSASGQCRRPALRPLRAAAVRLVSLPDPRSVRQGRRLLARPQAGAGLDHRARRGRQGRSSRRRSRPISANPGSRPGPRRRPASHLAVLFDPKEKLPPSDLADHPPFRADRRGAWAWESR